MPRRSTGYTYPVWKLEDEKGLYVDFLRLETLQDTDSQDLGMGWVVQRYYIILDTPQKSCCNGGDYCK